MGEVEDRLHLEAIAHATDDYVKCWNCGWSYKPTLRPNDRPKLKMGTPNRERGRTIYEHYGRIGLPKEAFRFMKMKATGRVVDQDQRR